MVEWIALGVSVLTLLGAVFLWFFKVAKAWSWARRSICSYLDGSDALRKMVFLMYGALGEAGIVSPGCSAKVLDVWSKAAFEKPLEELRTSVAKGNPMTTEDFNALIGFVNRVRQGQTDFSTEEARRFYDLATKMSEEVAAIENNVKDDNAAIDLASTARRIIEMAAFVLGKTSVPSDQVGAGAN